MCKYCGKGSGVDKHYPLIETNEFGETLMPVLPVIGDGDGQFGMRLVVLRSGQTVMRYFHNDRHIDCEMTYCPICGELAYNGQTDPDMVMILNTMKNWPRWKKDWYNKNIAIAEGAMKL